MVTVGPVEIAATAGTVVLVAERAITRPGPAPRSFTRPEPPIDVIPKHRLATNHPTSQERRKKTDTKSCRRYAEASHNTRTYDQYPWIPASTGIQGCGGLHLPRSVRVLLQTDSF